MLEKLNKLPSFTLIGSKAFEVDTEVSDTDVVILWKELPKELMSEDIKDVRIYFNVLPLGNSGLIKLENLDILLFEDESDIDIVRKAVKDIKLIPKYLLTDKYVRVSLFEEALKNYGFIESTDTLRL